MLLYVIYGIYIFIFYNVFNDFIVYFIKSVCNYDLSAWQIAREVHREHFYALNMPDAPWPNRPNLSCALPLSAARVR